MSRTSKFMAAAIALVAGATSLHAQDTRDMSRDALQMMMQAAPGAGEPSALRQQIRERIEGILDEIGSGAPQVPAVDGPITIEDIDRLNRSAERERTELEFEQARFERMQLELERLMTLYEAVRVIEEDEAEIAAAQAQQMMAMSDMEGEQQGSEQTSAASEQSMLPRVSAIGGVGGVFTATINSDDFNVREVEVGEITRDGFVVEEITANHVVLRGPMTGTLYRLSPTVPVPPPPPNNAGISDAIDLGQFPMAQF